MEEYSLESLLRMLGLLKDQEHWSVELEQYVVLANEVRQVMRSLPCLCWECTREEGAGE